MMLTTWNIALECVILLVMSAAHISSEMINYSDVKYVEVLSKDHNYEKLMNFIKAKQRGKTDEY